MPCGRSIYFTNRIGARLERNQFHLGIQNRLDRPRLEGNDANCLASITKPKAEVIKRMCRIVRDVGSLAINLFLRRR
jgi:hypothetical protein